MTHAKLALYNRPKKVFYRWKKHGGVVQSPFLATHFHLGDPLLIKMRGEAISCYPNDPWEFVMLTVTITDFPLSELSKAIAESSRKAALAKLTPDEIILLGIDLKE